MKPPQTQTIGVAGQGLLGRGIATCLLAHGFSVVATEPSPDARRAAEEHIARSIDDLVRRGGFPARLNEQWRARYALADAPAGFAACDVVIESILEDLDAKQRLFDDIESAVPASTPVASNTSALPITLLQRGRRHPNRFIGMHWAEPCHLARFIEVIRGEQTDDATTQTVMSLGRACGKEPALVRKDVEGFIVNRMAYAMYREAFHLLETGVADVETIDHAFRNAMGLWANVAGPFRWMDVTGLRAYAAVMERLFPQLSNAREVPAAMRELIESGAEGVNNLRGFYRYTPEEAERWRQILVENVWMVRAFADRHFPMEPPAEADQARG